VLRKARSSTAVNIAAEDTSGSSLRVPQITGSQKALRSAGRLTEAPQPAVAGLVVVGAGDLAAQHEAGAQGRGLVEQAEAAHRQQASGEVQRGGQRRAVQAHLFAARA
jgi:hypothetical protein